MTRQFVRRSQRTDAGARIDNRPATVPANARITELDALLDEIDAVLEQQTILTNFRQQPGQ